MERIKRIAAKSPPPQVGAQGLFAAPTGYPAKQLLAIIAECYRNLDNARNEMNHTKYDLAAVQCEVAASKLRAIQRQLDEAG